jgi:hypothetical protein
MVLNLPLDFLDDGKQYSARIYLDPGNGSVEVRDFIVDSSSLIIEKIPKNSGFSMKIIKLLEEPTTDHNRYPPKLNNVGIWEVKEDSSESMLILASNGIDGLTLSNSGLPDFLEMSADFRYLTAKPGNDDVGKYSIGLILNSSLGTMDEMNLIVEVVNVNDPPVIKMPEYVMMDAGSKYSILLKAEDIDPTSDILNWESRTDADFIELNVSDWRIEASPALNDAGICQLELMVFDGNGGSDEITMKILVSRPSGSIFLLPPDGSIEVREGQYFSYGFQYIAEGVSTDNVKWKMEKEPPFVEIDEETGILTGTPGIRDAGTYVTEVLLSEGDAELASTEFTIFVHRVNDPPGIVNNPGLVEVRAGESIEILLTAEDSDLMDGTLKWTIVKSPDFVTIDTEKGMLHIEPGEKDLGLHEIITRVEDPEGAGDELVFALFVAGDDDPDDEWDKDYNFSRIRIIPVEITSDVVDTEPYWSEDGSNVTIYYPFREGDDKVQDEDSSLKYLAGFVLFVSALTIVIHLFLKRS